MPSRTEGLVLTVDPHVLHKVDTETYPYIYEENATVTLKDDKGLVRCNVYRPKRGDKVPVLVTYGPYGKDIHYKE